MRERTSTRMRARILGSVAAAMALAGAVYVGVEVSSDDAGGKSAGAPVGPVSTASLTSGQETTSRLRAGARQVTDPATGHAVAREALVRVEGELAAARDPAEIQRLSRKVELIRQAMQRLGGAAEE
jgi:hypothetical protein